MSQEWKTPAPEGDDVQMPLGTGGDAAAEEYVPSSSKFKMNPATLSLILAFASALVVLYFLGQQNKLRSASAAEVAQSVAIDSSIKEWIRRHPSTDAGVEKGDSLTQFLQAFLSSTRTSPVEDPGVNPFEHVVKVEPHIDPITQVVTVTPTIEPPDPMLLEAAKEYGSLKLQMIMLGNPSSAMINNQMVQVGAKFKYLTVTEISASQVLLSYKDKTYELKSGGPGRP